MGTRDSDSIQIIRIVRVADEVWLASALLHKHHPLRTDFAIDEIVARAARESITGTLRPSLYVHVVEHCVANRPPNPNRYRMLFETAPGRRRLFRPGDPYDQAREGSKTIPSAGEIPREHEYLLAWYWEWVKSDVSASAETDPLLRMAKSGQEIWRDENPDEYVRRLREGWE